MEETPPDRPLQGACPPWRGQVMDPPGQGLEVPVIRRCRPGPRGQTLTLTSFPRSAGEG